MRNQKRSFARKFIAPLAAAFVASFSIAGLAVEIDGGYSNVFVLNNDLTKGGFKFGFGWDPANAGAGVTQTGTTLTLKPQTITCNGGAADKDTEWGCDGSGPNANYGKNWQDLLFYDNVLTNAAQAGNFKACIGGGDLDSTYKVQGFVKVFNADFSQLWYEAYADGPCFSIPYTIDGAATVNFQRGVILGGPNGLSGKDYGEQYVYLGATALPASGGANRDPNAIPVLPLGGLLSLIAIVGLLAARRLRT